MIDDVFDGLASFTGSIHRDGGKVRGGGGDERVR